MWDVNSKFTYPRNKRITLLGCIPVFQYTVPLLSGNIDGKEAEVSIHLTVVFLVIISGEGPINYILYENKCKNIMQVHIDQVGLTLPWICLKGMFRLNTLDGSTEVNQKKSF